MADHYVDVVDEEDNILGKKLRSQKYKEGFISRNVAVYLRDSEGKIVVCKRSPNKRIFPNMYDTAACGHVMAGEDYLDAAKRELKEEVGVDCDLQLLKKMYHEFEDSGEFLKFFTGVFVGTSDASIVLNDELSEHKKLTKEELEEHLEKDPESFCSPFRREIKDVLELIENASQKR